MPEDKKINLMPEDMRFEEIDKQSKKKDIFQVDLVVPTGQTAPRVKSGGSWWSKLGQLFRRQPHFGSPIAKVPHRDDRDKKESSKHKEHHHKDKKHSYEIPLHVPDKVKNATTKINYTEVKTDFKLPATDGQDKSAKKTSRPSWWSRWFAPKPKKPKGPKITRVEEKLIKPKELPEQPADKKETEPAVNLLTTQEPMPQVSEPAVLAPTMQDIRPSRQTPEININVDDDNLKPDFSLPEQIKQSTEAVKEPVPDQPIEASVKDKKEDKTPKFHRPEPRIRARFLEDGGGVDLIPTAAKTRSWSQVITLLTVALCGSVIIVGVFYTVLFFQSQQAEQNKLNTTQSISDIEQQILEYEDLNQEINNLGNEIRLANNLLTRHLYWTDFFALLEKYTIAEVYYNGFSSGNGGSLTMHAVAPDFNAVARQLKVLQQPKAEEFVSEANILSAEATETGVEFDIILVLKDKLFLYDDLETTADEAENNDLE